MAQFDVYKNTNLTTAKEYPYLLDIQNDLLNNLNTRVVIPLALYIKPIKHLMPQFRIEGQTVTMLTPEMAGVSKSLCTELVTNLGDKRSEIINAIDFMINGF